MTFLTVWPVSFHIKSDQRFLTFDLRILTFSLTLDFWPLPIVLPLNYSLTLDLWPLTCGDLWPTLIENRIYREEFTGKKCKTAILLYCFHTAGVLHIFMLYNLLGPGISFYRKSKIIVKRKPNYEIGWFHNWPMIISHRHFTNDDFPL